MCGVLLAGQQTLVQEAGYAGIVGCGFAQFEGNGLRGCREADVSAYNRQGIGMRLTHGSIETEENQTYLFQNILLKRYAICIDGGETHPANVIERAVDLHALRITGSSGYQKCVNYLWRGWLVQDENDPSSFIDYGEKDDTNYWTHVHPDRMRAPVYQNATQVIISIIYLGLFTGAINTVNPTGDLDPTEIFLYIFTFGFICDEFSKFYKVGRNYIGFWNVFNLTLYALLTTSLITRFMALSHPIEHGHKGPRGRLNELSYNFLGKQPTMTLITLTLTPDSFLCTHVLDETFALS